LPREENILGRKPKTAGLVQKPAKEKRKGAKLPTAGSKEKRPLRRTMSKVSLKKTAGGSAPSS